MTQNFIFLHGLCGSKDNFLYLQKYFPESTSFDLIGFGREKKPNARYDKDDFLDFLEKKITRPAIIIGYSLGALLAKEFALRHPERVKRIYAIGYPLQKTPDKMEANLRKDKFMSLYLDGNILAKMACHAKCCYKYALIPYGLLYHRDYFLSFWHYFSHTYTSASNTIKNTILQDEHASVLSLKDKIVFITGANDAHVDKTLLKGLTYYEIPEMNHMFFGFEKDIADIILATLDSV